MPLPWKAPVSTLPEARIAERLAPFLSGLRVQPPADLIPKLSRYLDLLLRWNARTNLTAVRDSEEIVTRHFGESLFTGALLAGRLREGGSLLDLGSGAGFPGLPIQLLWPGARVVLAESQGKKAAFLREVVRELGLATEVWAARVEAMPEERAFDVVTLRAVDRMGAMVEQGRSRLASGGVLVELTAARGEGDESDEVHAIPGRAGTVVRLSAAPNDVPRGIS